MDTKTVKEKLDAWVVELNWERDNYQAQLKAINEENKTLHQQVLQEKIDCLKGFGEMVSRKEISLSEQIKGSLARFDQENSRFHDKLKQFKITDASLREERQRLDELERGSRTVESEFLSKEEMVQKCVKETASLSEQIQTKSAENERLLDAGRRLKTELVQKEAAIKELTEKAVQVGSEKMAQSEKLVELEGSLKRLMTQAAKQQSVLEAADRVEKVELPQQEEELKRITEECERVQSEIQQKKQVLAELEQKSSAVKDKTLELQRKSTALYREHQSARTEQNRLNTTLLRRESAINQERSRYDELSKRISGLEVEITSQSEALRDLQERNRLLTDDIEKQESIHRDLVRKTACLETQSKITERQKLLDAVRHLKEIELPQRERKLEEIRQNIARQESVNQKLLKEMTSLEAQIKSKAEEKQEVLNTIKRLEEMEIPEQEAKLKEMLSETERCRAEIQKREGPSAGMGQEITTKTREMRGLQEELAHIRKQYQEAEANQKRLVRTLSSLEAEINQKQISRDELAKTVSQLESETTAQTEALARLQESVRLSTDRVSEQKAVHENLITEIKSLEAQIQVKTAAKEELLNSVDHLEKVELPLQEAKLEEMDDEISAREALRRKLLEEIASEETQIHAKTTQKQEVSDTVKRLKGIELPSQEARLKEARAELEKSQNEFRKRQDYLANLEQETYAEHNELLELQKEHTLLKEKLQEAESNRKELNKISEDLRDQITAKRDQREKVFKKRVHLASETNAGEGILWRKKEAAGVLEGKIRHQKDALEKAKQAHHWEKKAFSQLPFAKRWKTGFWLSLMLLIIGSLLFTIWQIFF